MKKRLLPILRPILLPALLLALCLGLAACTEQSKIDNVKQTVIPNCNATTVEGLVTGMLQNPVWAFEKSADGKQAVTVKGTIAGDSLPAWVKEQKLMDITFRFELDPKTDKYDPARLDGFPSLTTPEGVLQAYKVFVCK